MSTNEDGNDGPEDGGSDEIEWSTSEPEKTSKGLASLQKSTDSDEG